MFRLHIRTDNDAFTPTPWAEVGRILRETAYLVEEGRVGYHAITLTDANGNDIGQARFEEEE